MEQNYLKPVFDRRKRASLTKSQTVEIRVYFSRSNYFYVNTDISLYPGEWDNNYLSVIRRVDAKKLNTKLQKILNTYKGYIDFLIKKNLPLNKCNFQHLMPQQNKKKNNSFLDFMYSEIQNRNMQDSTRRMHLLTFEAVKRSGVIVTFDDLTPQNIARYDRFLRLEDNTRLQTTIHNYHKRLKPYINEALRLGLIEDTPYRIFKDKHGRYRDRQPLNEEEIKSIVELQIDNELLGRVRDLFLFCIYTGLSWIDLYLFDYKKDVVERNGNYFINKKRKKTGTQFFAPILRPAMNILKKYDYKFRVPVNQVMNYQLKKIKVMAGINKSLSMHTARHTFATTIVLANGIPVESLSRMLGHTKIAVTQIYAKILNSSVEKQTEKLRMIYK